MCPGHWLPEQLVTFELSQVAAGSSTDMRVVISLLI